jgi:hypothetical protein
MAVVRSVNENVPHNSETVVTTHTPTGKIRVKGFTGTGNAEALWTLYIGGTAVFDYMTSAADRNAYMLFPDQEADGVAVELKVTHQAGSDQAFRGSLIYT